MRGKKNTMKQVYIDTTVYCEEARLDTQKLKNIIKISSKQNDFTFTNKIDQADLLIYYACGHLRQNEVESIKDIKRMLSLKNDSSKLIVWGCLPKIHPIVLKDIYDGPLIGLEESWDFFCRYFHISKKKIFDINANVLSNRQKHVQTIDKSVYPRKKLLNLFASAHKLIKFDDKRIVNNWWYIKIVSGCNNCCTYCSDRLVYKSLRSQPINNIIKQFDLGLGKGYRNFFFTGRDSGSYGCDIGSTLPDLLDVIIKRYSQIDYKLFLNKISPNSLINMYPKLDPILSSGKIVLIGSHIQSGSDRILKLMGKNFLVREWVKIIKNIQKKYPKINLETSIMVGFPSETHQDFKRTVNLLNNILFDTVAVYKYEERPNLPSLKIRGRIPEEIKNKRLNKMLYYKALFKTKKMIKNGQFRAFNPYLGFYFDKVIKHPRVCAFGRE